MLDDIRVPVVPKPPRGVLGTEVVLVAVRDGAGAMVLADVPDGEMYEERDPRDPKYDEPELCRGRQGCAAAFCV